MASLATLASILEVDAASLQTLEVGDPAPVPLYDLEKHTATLSTLLARLGHTRALLSPLTAYLSTVESELSLMLAQLQQLQRRLELLQQLYDRLKTMDSELGLLAVDLVVPPDVVTAIVSGKVGPGWTENIRVVKERQAIIEQVAAAGTAPEACVQLKRLLDRLALKLVERLRDFVIVCIRALRHGHPSQVVQRLMLDARECYQFLLEQHPGLAAELRLAYLHTMRWYYLQQFTRYTHLLEKVKSIVVDDVIGGGGGSSWGWDRTAQTGGHTQHLTLGDRVLVLTSPPTAMLAQIAETNPRRYYMEVPFASASRALADNAAVEYLFLHEFFALSGEELGKAFAAVFRSLVEHVVGYVAAMAHSDVYGLLLCIRIVQALAREMDQRRIPALEDYVNRVQIVLWPKVEAAVEAHCAGLRRATRGSTKNPNVPHPVLQQFALLLAGLSLLEGEPGTVEPLQNYVGRMVLDYEAAMTRMAGKDKEGFLFNNYFLVKTVMENELGRMALEYADHFGKLVAAYSGL